MSGRPYRVAVGAGYLNLSGVHVVAGHLVLGCCERWVVGLLLLTEQDTDLVSLPPDPMPLPAGLPVQQLPCPREAKWAGRWLAMIEHLERLAPVVYFPNSDYRHATICPKLSSRVVTIGVLQADDPVHYEHAARLGPYWNGVVAVSDAIARRTADQSPALRPRLHTVPNAVHVPAACPGRPMVPGQPLRVIYHGVLNTHQKRILDIPEIVDRLVADKVPVRMTIVGNGPQREELVARCRGLIDLGKVEVLGTLPNAEMMRLLAEHDAYLLPSAFEGMPHAMLEAMAQGCVPVVSDIPSGVPEVVDDGVQGFRAPMGDVAMFAERLAELHADPARRAAMALAAHRRILDSPYDARRMVDKYIEIMDQAFENSRRGRFRRPSGPVLPPPAEVAGLSIFPVDHAVDVADVERALATTPTRRWLTGLTALWKRAERTVERTSPR